MQIIKRKELVAILNENKDLLGSVKEILLFHMNQLPRFLLGTGAGVLDNKVYKTPEMNPNLVSPKYQPIIHDRYRQFTR